MSDESDIRAGFLVCFGFERENGCDSCHIADDFLRPSLVPSPDCRSNIVNDRDPQLLGHMGEAHIESRIIDADKRVRPLIDHGLLQCVAQAEKEGNVLDDFHHAYDSQIVNVINDPYAALLHVAAAHAEKFNIRPEFLEFGRKSAAVQIAGSFPG